MHELFATILFRTSPTFAGFHVVAYVFAAVTVWFTGVPAVVVLTVLASVPAVAGIPAVAGTVAGVQLLLWYLLPCY
jgi:hypothetical protein